MGWTSYRPTKYKTVNGRFTIDKYAEAREVVNSFGDRFELIKDAMRGNVYYAAIKNKETNLTFAIVMLTRLDDGWFAYKEMDECEHPYYYDCPKSILNLLSPTNHEGAKAWRQACIDKASAKKNKQTMSSLPVGTVVKIKIGGKDTLVKKMLPAYQFKRNWWLIIGQNRYLSKPYRFDNAFEIVATAIPPS